MMLILALTLSEWLQVAMVAGVWLLVVILLYALATSRRGGSGSSSAGAGILERLRNEPALLSGLVGAAVALGASFGLELTSTQTGAIMAVVSAVLAVIVRSRVTPVGKAPPIE